MKGRLLAKPIKSKKGLNSPLFLLAAKKTRAEAPEQKAERRS